MPISLRNRLRQSGLKPVGATARKAPRRGGLLAPRAPGRPPPGYYNPDLDAGDRAADRGLGDSRIDTETANQRASTGYLTTKTRTEQDYGRATGALAQRFRDIGQANVGAAVSQGVADPGTLAASLRKRQELQQFEQTGLDTARSRTLEDAGTDYQYGTDDRALGLQRGERENAIFHLDTAAQRSFQARAAGYVDPRGKAKAKAKGKAKPAGKKKGKGHKVQVLSGGPRKRVPRSGLGQKLRQVV